MSVVSHNVGYNRPEYKPYLLVATNFLQFDANTLISREIACVGYIRRSKLVPQMSEQVAAFVKRLRKAKGLTQKQLAQLAGVSRDTIVQVEKGESEHGYSTVESVVLALGGRVDDIGEVVQAKPTLADATAREGERLLEIFRQLGSDDRAWLLDTAGRLYAMAEARTRARGSKSGLPRKGPHKP